MKVTELRRRLKEYLGDCDGSDASLIITDTLNIDKTALLMGDREVSSEEERLIFQKAERLKAGEPVRYITEKCEFMSLPFYVKSGVLIPRHDTEVLAEEVIKRLPGDKPVSLIDMCCGSGCIGVSIAYYMKNADVSMCDISDTAIEVSKRNAKNLIDNNRCKIFKMDLLKDFPDGEYDGVVSNPPYIKTDVLDTLDAKVKDFEPSIALDGGNDGLLFYKRIAKEARLKKGGFLAFEIGFDQGREVAEILDSQGYERIEVIKDIEGRDRVVLGYRML